MTSGIGVITSSTLVVAHSATGVNRRSRLVMMPSSAVVGVDDGEPGDAVLAADLVELLERRVGADRDRVGDDAGLGPLDQVDLVGLVLDREVAVQDADAALAGHRDRHPGLGDGVHRALETSGTLQRISRVSRLVVSMSLGATSDSPGSSRTSS